MQKNGFGVSNVYEEKPSGASDEKLLKFAQTEKRIISTHDKDFGSLVCGPCQAHGGVVLLRLRNQSPQNVISHLIPFFEENQTSKN